MNQIMRFFEYEHLQTVGLRETSKLIHDVAHHIDKNVDNSAEKTAGLRKLLEAKDCFVRASL